MSAATQTSVTIPTRAVAVGDLAIGMYVVELDRPWLESPFLFQGFSIDSPEILEQLRQVCRFVRVADTGGPEPAPAPRAPRPKGPSASEQTAEALKQRRRVSGLTTQKAFIDELPKARLAQQDLTRAISESLGSIRAGQGVEVEKLQAATEPVIASIQQNADALLWLASIRKKDNHAYQNALGSAVLATAVGVHLGLARSILENFALGALLLDIGLTAIPTHIAYPTTVLSGEDLKLYQSHVGHGLDILARSKGVPHEVVDIVRSHHERHDGSGYLQGLQGDQIPPLGKLAGIIDTYQTLLFSPTSPVRSNPHAVLTSLARKRDGEFQASVVEEFIQALGIYPTGSIVRLSDRRVGLVVEQNRIRRLQPKVMLVVDPDGTRYTKMQTIDLLVAQQGLDGKPLSIVECLKEGAFGIFAADFYL